MASTYTLPGPPGAPPHGARPASAVDRTRTILAGTTAVVSAVMVAWMALAPLGAPARRPTALLAGALPAPKALGAASAVMAGDAERIGRSARAGGTWRVGRREFGQALAEQAARRSAEPLVVYLAAAGASG